MRKLQLKTMLLMLLLAVGGLSPAWADNIYTQNYEGEVTADGLGWKTGTSGRFTPTILTESTNHFLSVEQSTRNNNGATVTGTELASKVAAGKDFTLIFDLRLSSSSNQTNTEFIIKDAANSGNLLSLKETGTWATTWTLNGTSTKVTLPNSNKADGSNTIADVTWCTYKLTRSGTSTFLTITNTSTDEVILERTLLTNVSETGGLGNIQFISSRYFANFAIDNIVIRDVEEGDLPALTPTTYRVNFTCGSEVLKYQDVATYVGYEVTASADQMASFYLNDKKYIYVSGNETITAAESDNVINLVFREAETWSYIVTSNLGIQIATGSYFEDETITYGYPHYQLKDNTLYTKGTTDKEYRTSFTLDEDEKSVELTGYESNKENVVYYSEAENIEGASVNTTGTNVAIRSSNAAVANTESPITLTTLYPGQYTLILGNHITRNNKTVTSTFSINGSSIVGVTEGTNAKEISDVTFNVNATGDFIWNSSTGDGFMDYVGIQQTKTAYTVKFVDEKGNSLKDVVVTFVDFNTEVSATDDQKADFFVNGTAYTLKSGDETITAEFNKENVITLVFSKVGAQDLTSTYITNASFESDEAKVSLKGGSDYYPSVTGWTMAPASAGNSQMGIANASTTIQGIAASHDPSNGNNYLYIRVNWQKNNEFSAKQTLENLAKGKWTLTVDLANSAGTSGANYVLSMQESGQTAVTNSTTATNSTWHAWSVSITKESAETTMDIKAAMTPKGDGNGQHYCMLLDNFVLTYENINGDVLERLIAQATGINTKIGGLTEAISTAQNTLNGINNTPEYQTTIDNAITTLQTAINDAIDAYQFDENGDDISSFILNGNFNNMTAITEDYGTVKGLDYASEGWTLTSTGDWAYGAVVAYGSGKKLNGAEIPAADNNGNGGNALGVSVGWGWSQIYQSEKIKLVPGTYVLKVNAYNAFAGAQQMTSLLGFVPTTGDPTLSKKTSFDSNTWVTDEVTFTLSETTEGRIQIGGKAISGGSGANAKVFFDNITLTYYDPLVKAQLDWQEVHDALDALDATALPDAAEAAITTELAKTKPETIDGCTTAQAALQALIDSYDGIKAAYSDFTAMKTAVAALKDEEFTGEEALTAFNTALSEANDAVEAMTTADGIPAQTAALKAAGNTFLSAITSSASFNATYNITNNSFETGDLTGWNANSANDTGVKPNSNATYTTEGIDGSYLFNTWGGSDAKYVKQTLTGLPEGFYSVKALAASDAGASITLYADEATTTIASDETSGKALFVEGQTSKVYVAADGSLEIGMTATDWYKADNFRLIFVTVQTGAGEALAEVIAEAKALKTSLAESVPDAILTQLQTVIDAYEGQTYVELEGYNTAIAAVRATITKANAYSEKATTVNNIAAVIESTNVYTTEAYETYNGIVTDYNAGNLTTDEVNALVDPKATTGWRAAAPAVSSFLISAWDSDADDWDGFHVNTWSAAGDFGETGFAVPLMEYWTGSGSLAAKTMTATVSGLEAGNYKVSADMFINTAEVPSGASLQVGEAAAATITGTQNGDFYVSTASAFGTVGEDGNLTIKLIVADGNNFNWIGFKNMKYQKVNVDYAELNATISNANVTNAKIAGGVQALTDAIAAAEALLQSLDQDEIDAGVTTLNAAITAAETTIAARFNLMGVVKKATALNAFLAESIESDITEASEYAASAAATTEETNNKATVLMANFSSWQTVTLTNADFNTGLNGELIEPGTEAKPYVHAVTGWTQAFKFNNTASQGIAAAYGSAAQNGTNGVAAPATDMYGSSEGGTLHLSSGWSDEARYTQTIATLAPGKYVLYYEGFNANNTTNALNSNFFGLNNLTAGVLDGSSNTYVYSNEKSFTYNEWKATAFEFELVNTATDATLNVGVIGGTGGSGSTPKMWFDNVTLYLVEEYPVAEATDYAALNAAITTAKENVANATPLGFDEGEYAPYNVAALSEVITTAEAIDQKAENLKSTIEAMTTAVTEATAALTTNAAEVDAIYNGDMAIANGWNPKGWTRSNNAWGQQITNLGEATSNGTAWYYNTDGAWVYGNDGSYIMPLKAETIYKLEFKYRSHDNNSNNWFKASIYDENSNQLFETQYPKATGKNWVSVVKIFKTGEAGNYTLNLFNSGNTYLSDVSLVKAEAEAITLAETETYETSETTDRYANVTFNRTLVEGWNGLVLPFDMTVEDVKSTFDASKVKDFSGITYSEESGVTLNFTDATEVKAGRPFMLKANKAGESYNIESILLPNVALQTVEWTDETATKIKYTMTGTYAGTTDLTDVVFVLIQGDKFFYHNTGKKSSAKAFRAYFVNNSSDPAAARVSFNLDDTPTGIVSIESEGQNAANTVYNLNGQRVDNPKKGNIYIVNGKKVMMK